EGPDHPGKGRAVGPPDPPADGAPAVEAERPGITEAVARAGLVSDPAADRVLRRRRADEHVADVPCGRRLHQPPLRRWRRAFVLPLVERNYSAEARQSRVEHGEVGQFDTDAAERDGEAGDLAFR